MASSSHGGDLYLFAKGIDDRRIFMNRLRNVFDRATRQWTGWEEAPGGGTTDASLAAADLGNPQPRRLFLFAKGIDDRSIHVNVLGGAAS